MTEWWQPPGQLAEPVLLPELRPFCRRCTPRAPLRRLNWLTDKFLTAKGVQCCVGRQTQLQPIVRARVPGRWHAGATKQILALPVQRLYPCNCVSLACQEQAAGRVRRLLQHSSATLKVFTET